VLGLRATHLPAFLIRARSRAGLGSKGPITLDALERESMLEGGARWCDFPGIRRHPVFLGLRTDKKATDVMREIPKPGAGPSH
jgi:hypothetical protein